MGPTRFRAWPGADSQPCGGLTGRSGACSVRSAGMLPNRDGTMMSKLQLEAAILGVVAALLAARGLSALTSGATWIAPRGSSPVHLLGQAAYLYGSGYLALAVLLGGTWLAFSRDRRGRGICLWRSARPQPFAASAPCCLGLSRRVDACTRRAKRARCAQATASDWPGSQQISQNPVILQVAAADLIRRARSWGSRPAGLTWRDSYLASDCSASSGGA